MSLGTASSRPRVTPTLRPFPPVALGGHSPGLTCAAAAALGAPVLCPSSQLHHPPSWHPAMGGCRSRPAWGPSALPWTSSGRAPGPPRPPTLAGCAPLTPTLPPQAAGDMPTTPKHPKDARENVFPAATAPVAPEPTPADAPPRPSDGHAKPRLVSATASTPDPAKDPGPPRLQRPEAAPSTSSLRPGESVPSTQRAGPAELRRAQSPSRPVAAEMWVPPVR